MGEPATRSNVERTFFGLLGELPAVMQAQLEAQTEPDHYRSARDARLLGWTPLSHAVGLRTSLLRLVGDDDRFVALMKDWALLSVSRPPFNVLSQAILRIYDRAPVSVLRAYARIWVAIYRDVGDYSVEQERDGSAVVVLRDPCPEARALSFRLYTLGVLLAVAEVGGGTEVRGTQRLIEGRLEFALQWA